MNMMISYQELVRTFPKPKPMMTGLAHLGHLVIYLLFIALPVIGLVMMYNRGNPWFAFGMTMPYASEANFERVDSLKSWHETLANGIFCHRVARCGCTGTPLFLEGQHTSTHDAA